LTLRRDLLPVEMSVTRIQSGHDSGIKISRKHATRMAEGVKYV